MSAPEPGLEPGLEPGSGPEPEPTDQEPARPGSIDAVDTEPAAESSAPAQLGGHLADPLTAAAATLTAAGYVVEAPTGATHSRRSVRKALGPLQLALAVIALLAGAALFLSGFSLGSRTASTPGTPPNDAALFKPFWDVWDSITSSYVGTIDRRKLVEGAIGGMMSALGDPYSSYMSSEDMRAAREALSGQFEGIGATIGTKTKDGTASSCATLGPDCFMTVVAPIDGSPAQKAGLLAGDIIAKIDGADVAGLTLDAAIKKVRGPKDTAVVLTVVRGGAAPIDIRIVRDTIFQPQVTTRDLAGGTIRYIQVAAFSDRAAADFAASVRAGVAQGERNFIVDLRDNGGGYVTAARTIASQFIASGPIFWEESADGHQESTLAEPGGAGTDPAIHVAVLVNRNSASASEIVAGALQDTGRGFLVGETTFGKGTIQAWVDLTDDAGGFHLTIAKWLTPDKRWIHHVGLTPDVVVQASGAATQPTGDPYIDAAIQRLGAPASLPVTPIARLRVPALRTLPNAA